MTQSTTVIRAKQYTLAHEILVTLVFLVLIGIHLLNTYRSGVEGRGIGLLLPSLVLVMIPGSFVYLMVMLIKKWQAFLRTQRICVIGLITLIIVIGGVLINMPGFPFCFPMTDLGVKRRVATCGGLTQLTTWATTMFEIPTETVIYLHGENLPDHVRCLQASDVSIFNRPHEENRRLDIIWGGGFHHWGILIIPQHQQLERYPRGWVTQWQPGIYAWYEDE
jgi:hypothetical protein